MYMKDKYIIVRNEEDDLNIFYNAKTDTSDFINDIGTIIYNAVDNNDIEEIVDKVCLQTLDDPKDSRDSIIRFLKELENRGIIHETTER